MPDPKHLERGLARLNRLVEARGLPGVVPATHEAAPALAVAGTALAWLVDANTLALACPVDQKVLLMDISPDLYFETEQQVGKDVMLIHLDRIGDEELSLRLHDAWEFSAPEKLKK